MTKHVKKWRLSDVVRAMMVDSTDPWCIERVEWLPRHIGEDAKARGVADTLRGYNVTFPLLFRTTENAWLALTDEQRADLVVAEARRLRVPRRG